MTKTEKIAVVAGMLLEGKAAKEIKTYIENETDWGIAEKTIENYIAEAKELNAGEGEAAKDIKVNQATNGKDEPKGGNTPNNDQQDEGDQQPGTGTGDNGTQGQDNGGDASQGKGENPGPEGDEPKGFEGGNQAAYNDIKNALGQPKEDQVEINITKEDIKNYPALKEAGVKKKAKVIVKYSDYPRYDEETYGTYIRRVFTDFADIAAEVINPEPKAEDEGQDNPEPEKEKKEKKRKGGLEVVDPTRYSKRGKDKPKKRSLSTLRGKSHTEPQKKMKEKDRVKAEHKAADYLDDVIGRVETLIEAIDNAVEYQRVNLPQVSNRRLLNLKKALKVAKNLK